MEQWPKEVLDHNLVVRPKHYIEGRTYEPIDVIEDWKLNYHLGNALKYISRAGRKDAYVQDLAKAIWYLERELKHAQGITKQTRVQYQRNKEQNEEERMVAAFTLQQQ